MKLRPIKVWGKRALFTQPETSAEPSTYPAITPTGAKGFLENIFWKPEMRYVIDKVIVLNPIKTTTVLLNRVKDKITYKQNGNGFIFTEIVPQEQKQRDRSYHTYLIDVAYVIYFHIQLTERANAPVIKYIRQFNDSVNNGRCFRQPYLGKKDCIASFDWATGNEQPCESLKICDIDMGFLPMYIAHDENEHRNLRRIVIKKGIMDYAESH
jgi:CRISPR-associated protein Cas5d